MQPPQVAPDTESFLLRVVHRLADERRGASHEQIDRIEQIAGRPLPPFYRWFLAFMGANLGSLAYRTVDFRAEAVLDAYDQEIVPRHPRVLLIGPTYPEEDLPVRVFYDLERPARDDAAIMHGHGVGDLYWGWETFREGLCWAALFRVITAKPHVAEGLVIGDEETIEAKIARQLDPVMQGLGFATPILTGPCCALYERSDAAMVIHTNPYEKAIKDVFSFHLGGDDEATLRRILGTITRESRLQIRVQRWKPAKVS